MNRTTLDYQTTFVVARLSNPTVTGVRFEISKRFDLNEFLRGSFGLFKGHEDFEVVVDLDAFAADNVRSRRWHRSQELTDHPRGGLTLKLRLNSLEEVERWVLGFGSHARVVQPQELRNRVGKAAREIQAKYL